MAYSIKIQKNYIKIAQKLIKKNAKYTLPATIIIIIIYKTFIIQIFLCITSFFLLNNFSNFDISIQFYSIFAPITSNLTILPCFKTYDFFLKIHVITIKFHPFVDSRFSILKSYKKL